MKEYLILLCLLFVASGSKAQLVDAFLAEPSDVVERPAEAWNDAEWISVADAPVVTGRVEEDSRAADGASWFATTIRNEKKVKKALWMTTSLGVNELYVNGQRIGREVLQTGFLGTSILMPTLTDNGMADVAYTLLFQRKNPSWLYSVDNGATTIWERWNSYTLEKGMGPKGMNSFNHYAYGCVCQWLWQTCAGIAADPAQPGFKHIIMRPMPDRRLGHLDATYQSASGLIKSSWRYEGDVWRWDVTIPEGSTATITLPDGQEKNVGAGSYSFQLQNV